MKLLESYECNPKFNRGDVLTVKSQRTIVLKHLPSGSIVTIECKQFFFSFKIQDFMFLTEIFLDAKTLSPEMAMMKCGLRKIISNS